MSMCIQVIAQRGRNGGRTKEFQASSFSSHHSCKIMFNT